VDITRNNDRVTRRIPTMYKMHHPKDDTDRRYAKRTGERRGLQQIAATFKEEIAKAAEYLNTKYKEY
jgi:hypothetical protein